jgi:hypothetical protein
MDNNPGINTYEDAYAAGVLLRPPHLATDAHHLEPGGMKIPRVPT